MRYAICLLLLAATANAQTSSQYLARTGREAYVLSTAAAGLPGEVPLYDANGDLAQAGDAIFNGNVGLGHNLYLTGEQGDETQRNLIGVSNLNRIHVGDDALDLYLFGGTTTVNGNLSVLGAFNLAAINGNPNLLLNESNGGDVAIGTDTARSKLDVAGDISTDAVDVYGLDDGVGNTESLSIGFSGGNGTINTASSGNGVRRPLLLGGGGIASIDMGTTAATITATGGNSTQFENAAIIPSASSVIELGTPSNRWLGVNSDITGFTVWGLRTGTEEFENGGISWQSNELVIGTDSGTTTGTDRDIRLAPATGNTNFSGAGSGRARVSEDNGRGSFSLGQSSSEDEFQILFNGSLWQAGTQVANGVELVAGGTKAISIDPSTQVVSVGNAGGTEFTLPVARGAENKILKLDANGNLLWSDDISTPTGGDGTLKDIQKDGGNVVADAVAINWLGTGFNVAANGTTADISLTSKVLQQGSAGLTTAGGIVVDQDGSTGLVNSTPLFTIAGDTLTAGTAAAIGQIAISDGSNHTTTLNAAPQSSNLTLTLPPTAPPVNDAFLTGQTDGTLAWSNTLSLSGPLAIPFGSQSAPGLGFVEETNTGIWGKSGGMTFVGVGQPLAVLDSNGLDMSNPIKLATVSTGLVNLAGEISYDATAFGSRGAITLHDGSERVLIPNLDITTAIQDGQTLVYNASQSTFLPGYGANIATASIPMDMSHTMTIGSNYQQEFDITSTGNFTISDNGTPAFTATGLGSLFLFDLWPVQIQSGTFRVADADKSHYMQFQQDDLSSNMLYTWPAAHGSAGHVLTNDGSGGLAWSPPGAGIGGAGQDTQIAYFDSTNTITGNAKMSFNGNFATFSGLSLGAQVEVTIAGSGYITATGSNHSLRAFSGTEGDLLGINTGGIPDGTIVILSPISNTRIKVVDQDSGGNLLIKGDAFLASPEDSITLQLRNFFWYEISRAVGL